MKDILYWGNKKIGSLLKKKYQNTHISRNFKEFEFLTNSYSDIIFYIESTRTYLKKMVEIVRKNQNKKFYILSRIDDKYPNSNSLQFIFDEKNIIRRVFSINELIREFQEV